MYRYVLTIAVSLLAIISARDATAQVGQPWTDRGYINLNAGFESTSGTLTDATTVRIYDEDGSFNVTQPVDSGALFDVSGGVRVWRNFSIGLGYHRGANRSDGTVQGSVPHPLFFNRPRPIALTVNDLDRTEQAVHLQFGYMLGLTDRIDVHLAVGPSFFRLKQAAIGDVTFTEQSPFTTVTAAASVVERSDSAPGFNVGADVAYRVYETGRMKVGVGLLIRYTGATANITVFRNEVSSDLGGLHVGFGGRLRF